jgi:hypothetical protein
LQAVRRGKMRFKRWSAPSPLGPSYILKHICSKWLNEKKRYCLETHPDTEHIWAWMTRKWKTVST